jgi:hypothetical protein
LQQRIVRDSAQRDTGIRKNVGIVFQVLSDFQFLRIFQPAAQLFSTSSRGN